MTTDDWTTGGYFDPMDELEARRSAMSREGMTPCQIAACNCGSWHRRLSWREARMEELIRDLVENDPNADAADGVSVLDVWRKEADQLLR